jgi:hypothetical protein
MANTLDLLIRAKLKNEASRPIAEIKAEMASLGSTAGKTDKEIRAQARSLEHLGREARRAAKEQKALEAAQTQLTRQMSSSMINRGAQMTIGVTAPMAAAAYQMLKFSSSLTESTTRAQVVFGEYFGELDAFADGSARRLGQSRQQVFDFASSFSALMQPMGIAVGDATQMSLRLTQLATDMASFKNTSIDQAATAIQSALAGEIEPMRRYSIDLTEATLRQEAMSRGITKSVDKMSQQEKTLLRYSVMMKKSALIDGDWARTQGNLANQTRTAKAALSETAAELGENLVPMALKMVQAATALAEAIGDLPEPAQDALLVLGGIVAIAGPMLVLAGAVMKVQLAMKLLAAASIEAGGAGLLGSAGSTAGKLGAIGAGALGGAVAGNMIVNSELDPVKKAGVEQVLGRSLDSIQTVDDINAAIAKLTELHNSAVDEMDSSAWFEFAGRKFGQDAAAWGTIADATGDAYDILQGRLKEAQTAKLATDATMGNTAGLDAQIQAAFAASDAIEKVVDVFQSLDLGYDAVLGKILGADKAAIAFGNSVAGLNKTVKDVGSNTTEAQSATIDVFEAAYAQARAEAASGLITVEDIAKRTEELLDSVKIPPGVTDQLENYKDRLDKLGGAVNYIDVQLRVGVEADELVYQLLGMDKTGRLAALTPGQRPPGTEALMGPYAAPGAAPITPTTGNIAPDLAGEVRASINAGLPRPRGGTRQSMMPALRAASLLTAGVPGTHRVTNVLGGDNDHASGRAFDVVGPHLNQITSRARDAGMYAELHGTGNQRHLHVAGAFDSMPQASGGTRQSMMPSLARSRSASSTVINQTVTVVAGPGQSVDQLASAVVSKSLRMARDAMERGTR